MLVNCVKQSNIYHRKTKYDIKTNCNKSNIVQCAISLINQSAINLLINSADANYLCHHTESLGCKYTPGQIQHGFITWYDNYAPGIFACLKIRIGCWLDPSPL